MGIRNLEYLTHPDDFNPKEYPFMMRAYYADNVKPPKTPGALAIETRHKTKSSMDIEAAAARSRDDIGRIDTYSG